MIQIQYDSTGFTGNNNERPVVRAGTMVDWSEFRSFVARGGLNEVDVDRVIAYFTEHLAYELSQGRRVRTPLGLFSLSCTASGILRRDKRRMKVRPEDLHPRLKLDRSLIRAIRDNAQIRYEGTRPLNYPGISVVTVLTDPSADPQRVHGESVTVTLPCGESSVLQLRGLRLSIDPIDLETGLFLVPLSEGQKWTAAENPSLDGESIRVTIYPRCGSKYLQGVPPTDLPPGRYGLRLVTRPAKCRLRPLNTGIVCEFVDTKQVPQESPRQFDPPFQAPIS